MSSSRRQQSLPPTSQPEPQSMAIFCFPNQIAMGMMGW